MLKKTITEMGSGIIENPLQKRSDSRNNIPKPTKSSTRKLNIETNIYNFSSNLATPKAS